MKVGIVSSCVPLVYGGGRNIVDWLHIKLQEYGQQSEVVYVPNTDEADSVLAQMTAFRLMRLQDHFDRIITIRPPAHVVRHPVKVVWFIHHFRLYYDLWGTHYYDMPDTAPWRAQRAAIMRADTTALREAHRVFTNSAVVRQRLQTFNGIASEVLYPPILRPESFHADAYGDEIVCVCRFEAHKRQHLLVEAMTHVRSGVRLRLCGTGTNPEYVQSLQKTISSNGLSEKIIFDNYWISEEEKAQRLAGALAVAYVPYDEDSYGYTTIEAAHASRSTITTSDAGGVLEFVEHGVTGQVVPPRAEALAEAFDQLYADRAMARTLGESASQRLDALGINWEHVIEQLLA